MLLIQGVGPRSPPRAPPRATVQRLLCPRPETHEVSTFLVRSVSPLFNLQRQIKRKGKASFESVFKTTATIFLVPAPISGQMRIPKP